MSYAFPTDQNASRLGQINKAGDTRELFLKLYAGEVLRAFNKINIMRPLHKVKSLQGGKSHRFPLLGGAKAKYHTPGKMIEADAIGHTEREVKIDDLLISSQFIANIDEAMNHYDVRSEYAKQSGQALSDLFDRNVLRVACQASFITTKAEATTAKLNPLDDEVFTKNIDLSYSGDELDGKALVDAIFAAKTEFEEKSVSGEPVIILRPAQYYALFEAEGVDRMQWLNSDVGGTGSFAEAKIPMIAGMRVYKSVQLPSTDESAGLGGDDPESNFDAAKYRGDYSKVVGLVMTQEAVATAQLMNLNHESEYQMSRQGTLMLSKMAVGHDILRPACAITILKSDTARPTKA
ncbi:Capsid protein [Vibrio crassostreae]|nr:Capsid protein [Vibrio crassostreae]